MIEKLGFSIGRIKRYFRNNYQKIARKIFWLIIGFALIASAMMLCLMHFEGYKYYANISCIVFIFFMILAIVSAYAMDC